MFETGGRPLEELVTELSELVRIPSVSPLPGFEHELMRAAEWIGAAVLAAGGFAEVLETDGNPLVVGRFWCGREDAPSLLCYGHYDVQGAGAEELWASPPFEPRVRDGCLYGRGTADDKGGLHALLAATADLATAGELPCDVTLLADGEEEVGGESAVAWLSATAEPYDAAIIFDSIMAAPSRPQLTVGLRGLAAGRVALTTSASDFHSGVFGGVAANAAHVLAKALAEVTPEAGRLPPALALGAAEPSEEELESWAASLPAGAEVLAKAGAIAADPEAAERLYERTFARPSLDVLGLASGTVAAPSMAIPATAEAVVSLRVVPGQDAERSWASLVELLREQVPAGARLESELLIHCPAWSVDPEVGVLREARQAIAVASGHPCALARHGGSIPLVAALGSAGTPVVLSGVALPDDGIHAANERIPLESYALAYRMARSLICTIGRPTRDTRQKEEPCTDRLA